MKSDQPEKVYVAIGTDCYDGFSSLQWALRKWSENEDEVVIKIESDEHQPLYKQIIEMISFYVVRHKPVFIEDDREINDVKKRADALVEEDTVTDLSNLPCPIYQRKVTSTMVDTRWCGGRNRLISWWFMAAAVVVVVHRSITIVDSGRALLDDQGVTLVQKGHYVVMENGIVNLTLTVPNGSIAGVSYKGSENLLQTLDYKDEDNGYEDNGQWNIVWNTNVSLNVLDKVEGTNYTVILESENQTEISFTTTWNFSSKAVPLNVDIRFVMLRGSPGFYTYAVLERIKGWPSFQIKEGRIVFQLQQNKFDYMAVSDERQRFMPTAEDREKGQALEYKEAVLLTNPSEPEFKGEVDDKYFYTCNNEDNKVHGWVSNDSTPIGFWLITPSNEFRSGGPIRQDLTSHVGPCTLGKFSSRHYGGDDLAIKFKSDEYWKKVIGPFYIHLNSDASAKANPSVLWDKAKQRMEKEVSEWPYSFPLAKDFVHSDQRGSISGQLLVHDRFLNESDVPAALAYVGLVPPAGSEDSWQFETKGYQFWTHADEGGNFSIKNIIPGTYSLFAWVPGVIGDFKHDDLVTIAPGSNLTTKLVFNASREGPTLWEIGIPDRSAGEFFIPDPNPKFKIHRYASPVEKFRQYGLWDRYTDLYPSKDLVFTIGESNYTKDWFFAHVTRNAGNGVYEATTWQVLFDLVNVTKIGNYTLRLALASAQNAILEVRFNDLNSSAPYFTTPLIGKDNALARHGVRGVYYLYSVGVEGSQLVDGRNAMFLKQVSDGGPFKEVMYDYIRLEGPV